MDLNQNKFEEILLFYVKKWIENVNNSISNNSILLVDSQLKEIVITLINKEQLENVEIFNLNSDSNYKKFLRVKKQKIVFYCNTNFSTENLKMINWKEKYLFIGKSNSNLIIRDEFINKYSVEKHFGIDPTLEDYLYIKEIDICKLISLTIEKDLFFLKKILHNYIHFFFLFYKNQESTVFKDIKYPSYENFIILFPDEIKFLCSEKLMTARFAMFLYRITSFDFIANKTKIGRHYAKSLYTKSKVLPYLSNIERCFRFKNIFLDKKSIRVYDLLKNDLEEKIRKEIAKNLLSLDLNEVLSLPIISNATKLSIKTLEKIQEDILINNF